MTHWFQKENTKNIKYFIVFAPLDVGDMVSGDVFLLCVFHTIGLVLHLPVVKLLSWLILVIAMVLVVIAVVILLWIFQGVKTLKQICVWDKKNQRALILIFHFSFSYLLVNIASEPQTIRPHLRKPQFNLLMISSGQYVGGGSSGLKARSGRMTDGQ